MLPFMFFQFLIAVSSDNRSITFSEVSIPSSAMAVKDKRATILKLNVRKVLKISPIFKAFRSLLSLACH